MTISFDSAQHDNLLDGLHSATSAIQHELDELEAAVKNVRRSWNGAAREAYETAQKRWTAAMKEMHAVLAQADLAAAQAGEALSSAERASIKIWV